MENKIQKNYDELKKISDLTKQRVEFIDKLNLDYKDTPLTKKGMEKAVKKLMKKLDKKEKEKKKEKK